VGDNAGDIGVCDCRVPVEVKGQGRVLVKDLFRDREEAPGPVPAQLLPEVLLRHPDAAPDRDLPGFSYRAQVPVLAPDKVPEPVREEVQDRPPGRR
jgi:hypothetical protein